MDALDPATSRSLRDVVEKQAILELVHCYSRAVDRRDYRLLESLYAADGVDDHTGLFCGPARDFVAWLAKALEGVDATTHHVHNALIAVDGDRAEGEVYLTAYNRLRAADGSLSDFVQGLRYLDQYRRESGHWRFARRTVVCDWARHGPSAWDPTHPLVAGKRLGEAGIADASYAVLASQLFARTDERGRAR